MGQSGCSQSLEWVVPVSAFVPRGVPPAPTPSQRKASLQLPLSLETLGRALPFLGWELPAYGVVWEGISSWGCKRLQVVGSWETALPSWGWLCKLPGKEQEETQTVGGPHKFIPQTNLSGQSCSGSEGLIDSENPFVCSVAGISEPSNLATALPVGTSPP